MANKQRNGIFIDNLQPWVTEEILWMQFQRQNIDGIQVIKIPRDFSSNQLRGYAICGFDNRENAIKAKEQLNYTEVLGNELRIALLADETERDPANNFIVTNLSTDIKGKDFDKKISEFGPLISSKIQVKENKDAFGYIQFLNKADAEKFTLATLNKEVKIGETTLQAHVFKKHEPVQTEKKNIYLKDFATEYTEEQLKTEGFTQSETEKIEASLKEKFAQFGAIASLKVIFNAEYGKPFAFACFEKAEEAEKAFDAINKEEEFQFKYIAWQKTKKEMQEEAEKAKDKKFIFMRNIKQSITQAQLFKIFSGILKVSSIRVKQPPARYTTNFATIVTEEANKLDFLKNCIKEGPYKNQELLDIFEKDKKPYITYCFPRKQHKEWVKKNFNKRLGYGNIPLPRGAPIVMPPPGPFFMPPPFMPMRGPGQAPPGMMMPHMMPPYGFMPPMPQQPQQPGSVPPRVSRPPQQPRNFSQQNQQHYQQRRPYQQNRGGHQQQQNYQNRRPYNQNQNRGPQQQNRGPHQGPRPAGQPKPVGQPKQAGKPAQYQPKPVGQAPKQVQPKPVGQAPKPAQQPQQAQPQAPTIQAIRAKWSEFLKQDKAKQTQIFGVLIYPKIQQYAQNKAFAPKITGMLIDQSQFTPEEIADLIANEEEIKERVEEAEELLGGSQ